jgi:hypothetical protein
MKKSELKQIIKEEIKKSLNEGTALSAINKYKDKTGPEGLIISKLTVLERTLNQLKKIEKDTKVISLIDMVLKTFDEIREI